MSTDAWIGVAAGIVGIAGAVIGYAKFMVQAPLVAENAKVEAKNAQADAALADAERRSDHDRERLADLDTRYKTLQQDIVNLRLARPVCSSSMKSIPACWRRRKPWTSSRARSFSGPQPDSSSFVFLSINGPAAAKLRLAKLTIDSGIVGRVFATGKLHNTINAYGDPNFFSGIDKKGEHETQTMLTIPLSHNAKTVGVAQFLNKPGAFRKPMRTERRSSPPCSLPRWQHSPTIRRTSNYLVSPGRSRTKRRRLLSVT